MAASDKRTVQEPSYLGGAGRPVEADGLLTADPGPPLAELVYELLDAHADTTRLAGELAADLRWNAHLAYLRDLQRLGRTTLARLGVEKCG